MKMTTLRLTFNDTAYVLTDDAGVPLLVGPDGRQYASDDIVIPAQQALFGMIEPTKARSIVNYGKLDDAIYEREPASDKPGCEEIGSLTDAARALIDLRYRFLA